MFFNNDLNENKAILEFNSILLMDEIEEGIFINKAQAANIFKSHFDEDIIEILGENPLPFSAVYTVSEENRNYASIQKIINDIDNHKRVIKNKPTYSSIF